MKIELRDLVTRIEKQNYEQELTTVKYSAISHAKKKLHSYAAKMVEDVRAAFKKQELVQAQLAVTGQRPVTFALETNIINLPYANYKRISNFFEEGHEYALNVYFETQSDYVNVSHFRIDQLATEKELEADPEKVITQLVAAIQDKLKTVRHYQPVKKTKTSKRKTAKKTTRKRRARKTRKRK